jgi:hypothetical protein
MKYTIRRGGFGQQPYLSRAGTWVMWQEAAKFATQELAAAHAEKCQIGDNYGLFCFDMQFPQGVSGGKDS